MHPFTGPAALIEFAGKNIAHNLDFIPADRLAWKPAPEAKSALEIITHVAGFTLAMIPVPGGGAFTWSDLAPPAEAASARDLILRATSGYADALRACDYSALPKQIELPFGAFPTSQALSMPVFDTIHHHGQIIYIQTLLGDAEDHWVG